MDEQKACVSSGCDPKAYSAGGKPTWCPGCGNYGILWAVQKACANLRLEHKDVLIVSGIGCSAQLPRFFKAYGYHGLHGRAIPIATGAKLANPGLTVIAVGGDGDGYGIGMGHFIHAVRRNADITYIVSDNQTYGLTKGQTSPTTDWMAKTKSTPRGSAELPVNPMALALAAGAGFAARGFSGAPDELAGLVEKGIRHKGFSLIDVLSPCVTFNKRNTFAWFKERVSGLGGSGHDVGDRINALAAAWGQDGKIPVGVFYEEDRPRAEDFDPAYKLGAPAESAAALSPEAFQELTGTFI